MSGFLLGMAGFLLVISSLEEFNRPEFGEDGSASETIVMN
jgi:hypothetical protein